MSYVSREDWPSSVLGLISFFPTLSQVNDTWYHNVRADVLDGTYVPRDFTPSLANDRGHRIGAMWDRDNDFNTSDQAYLDDLLTMGIIIVCLGVVMMLIIPLIYMCVAKAKCCCRKLRHKPLTDSHVRYWYIFTSAASMAFAICYCSGLVELNRNINKWESNVYTIGDVFGAINELAGKVVEFINEIVDTFNNLNVVVTDCASATGNIPLNLTFHNITLNQTTLQNRVQLGVDEIMAVIGLNFDDLQSNMYDLGDTIGNTDKARLAFGYMLLTLLLIVMVAYVLAGWLNFFDTKKRKRWASTSSHAAWFSCFASPLALLVVTGAVVFSGASIVLLAASGDYCQDPDTNTLNTITNNPTTGVGPLVEYYTTCNSTTLPIDEVMYILREAVVVVIQTFTPVLDSRERIDESTLAICPDIMEAYDALENALFIVWFGILKLSLFVECPVINALYDLVAYQTFCVDLSDAVQLLFAGSLGLTLSLAVTVVLYRLLIEQKRVVEAIEADALLDGVDAHDNDDDNNKDRKVYCTSVKHGGHDDDADDDNNERGGGGGGADGETSPLKHRQAKQLQVVVEDGGSSSVVI